MISWHKYRLTCVWLQLVVECLLVRVDPGANSDVEPGCHFEQLDCCSVHCFIIDRRFLAQVCECHSIRSIYYA